MIKVIIEKQIGSNAIIGKVTRKNKTKWELRIINQLLTRLRNEIVFEEYSFRKSRFNNINKFEEFVRKRYAKEIA